jgi:hypothetical protein
MKILRKSCSTLIFVYSIIVWSIIISCNSNHLIKTPIENFKGIWELQGREMFKGIKIDIEQDKDGKLIGKVVELNDNKYVKMFVEINDIWVSDITRYSNFEFRLNEKKIGSALFSVYGQETSKEFKTQFIDNNTIGLASQNTDPLLSTIKYVRVVNK